MKKKNKKSQALVIATLLLILIIAAVLFGYNKASAPEGVPDGYVRVDSFVYIEPGQPACLALMPACGICPDGVVVDKQCYMPPEQADNWN